VFVCSAFRDQKPLLFRRRIKQAKNAVPPRKRNGVGIEPQVRIGVLIGQKELRKCGR
jgi:hypothetical protein